MNPNQNESDINLSSNTFGGANAVPHASILYSKFQPSAELPLVVRALVKSRIVQNETHAQKLILAVIFLFIIAAVTFFVLAVQGPSIRI